MLLATILFTLIGTGFELVFLGHIEDFAQWIPIGLIVLALGVLTWYGIGRTSAGIRAFQAVMALFFVAGIVGIGLHARSNVEFAMEMYPNIERMELLRKTAAGAIPALAPGTMIQIGLIGLAYTYRHPALNRRSQ